MEESIWLGSYAGFGGFSSLKGVPTLGDCVLPRELGQAKSRGLPRFRCERHPTRQERKRAQKVICYVVLFCCLFL